MKRLTSDSGFSIIELLLVIVAFGLIGFAARYVYQTNKLADTLNTTTVAQSAAPTAATTAVTPVLVTPVVQTPSDLTAAAASLDQTDPTTSNSSDSATLDTELASF